jgi:hypothetical protein
MEVHKYSPHSIYRILILFILFIFICLVIGYATVTRYDPSLVSHMDDTKYYLEIVKNGLLIQSNDARYTRFIIPLLAHFIYIKSTFTTFNGDVFSFLLLNSIFVSVTALSLIRICKILNLANDVILASLFFYFTSFVIINHYLVGYLDAYNAMMFSFLSILILERKWSYKILIISIFGCVSKETFLISSSVFLISWFLIDYFVQKEINFKSLIIVTMHLLISLIVVFSIKYYISLLSGEVKLLNKINYTYTLQDMYKFPVQIAYVYAPAFIIIFSKVKLPSIWLISGFSSLIIIFTIAFTVGITGHGLGRISFEMIGIIYCILCGSGLCNIINNKRKEIF